MMLNLHLLSIRILKFLLLTENNTQDEIIFLSYFRSRGMCSHSVLPLLYSVSGIQLQAHSHLTNICINFAFFVVFFSVMFLLFSDLLMVILYGGPECSMQCNVKKTQANQENNFPNFIAKMLKGVAKYRNILQIAQTTTEMFPGAAIYTHIYTGKCQFFSDIWKD